MGKNKEVRSMFVAVGVKLNDGHSVSCLEAHIRVQAPGQAHPSVPQIPVECPGPPVSNGTLQAGHTGL